MNFRVTLSDSITSRTAVVIVQKVSSEEEAKTKALATVKNNNFIVKSIKVIDVPQDGLS
jgi:DNA-binding cell septation regulator SpoVG